MSDGNVDSDGDVTEETALLLQQNINHDASKTRNTGGLTKKMPTRGYCLVFNKELKDKYIVTQEKDTLVMTVTSKKHNGKTVNLLQNFIETNIQYFIHQTKDIFFVIIAVDDAIAKEWADDQDYLVPIEPCPAIQKGKNYVEFDLAQNTHCPDCDSKEDKTLQFHGIEHPLEKLDLSMWNHIHLPYDTVMDNPNDPQNVYKQPVLNDRLYLSVLYDILTSDYKLGGAKFVVERKIRKNKHPLKSAFALHGRGDKHIHMSLSSIYNSQFFWPSTWFGEVHDDEKNGIIDDIRDYYGEYIAFYFLFTVYYIKTLYPMVIIGVIWFIAQVTLGDIAVSGSLVGVIIVILWTTIMLEYWYRIEHEWRFKWGVISYDDTHTQPQFKGRYIVSPESGMVVETHPGWWSHKAKILFSLSTMFFFIAIVIALVATIWILKNRWKNDTTYYILIGIINAIEIQILNAIYTRLAVKLNEFENHRLKLDYYNHLVVKRIFFIVVNSFNSLFYIAFYEEGYASDTDRLFAVRIQLLTLFFTAIVIQNGVELGFPALKHWIKTKLDKRTEKPEQLLEEKDDADDHEYESNDNNEMHDDIYLDVQDQMMRSAAPSLLDNTAEVVVLHGYIILFVVVFPAMPLLALINNYFEIGIDYYNLLHSQRPVPFSSAGIGVWKSVISIFNIVAVFSNLALLTFKTTLVSELVGDSTRALLLTFFILCMVLIAFQLILRTAIADASEDTRCAIKRQDECERYLIKNTVKKLFRQQSQHYDALDNI